MGLSGHTADVPSDEFIEDFNVFLQVLDRCRILCVEDSEGGGGCTVIDVGATGLNEAADEDDFEEGVCIFQELERGSSLYEFCRKCVEVVLWDSFEVFVELVSEYWRRSECRCGLCTGWNACLMVRALLVPLLHLS